MFFFFLFCGFEERGIGSERFCEVLWDIVEGGGMDEWMRWDGMEEPFVMASGRREGEREGERGEEAEKGFQA